MCVLLDVAVSHISQVFNTAAFLIPASLAAALASTWNAGPKLSKRAIGWKPAVVRNGNALKELTKGPVTPVIPESGASNGTKTRA